MSDLRTNANKFYIIQVLQHKYDKSVHLWTRYGRVGYKGQSSLINVGCSQNGTFQYRKKKNAKKWYGYTEIKMALGNKEQATGGDDNKNKEVRQNQKQTFSKVESPYEESMLEQNVQSLVEFIFDHKLMESAVVAMDYDVKRMPLGELSK